MDAITTFFKQGGFWMWPILGMSIVALAVMLERFYALFMTHNINAALFMEEIKIYGTSIGMFLAFGCIRY